MDEIIELVIGNENVQKLLWTVTVILLGVIIKKIIYKLICMGVECNNRKFAARRILTSISWIFITGSSIVIWIGDPKDIVAFIGIFSAGMAIAMKDIWLNILGGGYITLGNIFRIGDRIEVMGHIGDVIDVKLLGFDLLEVGNRVEGEQSTGRIIHLPNFYVFNHALVNYEKGFRFIWNEVKVVLTKESNWVVAKKNMEQVLEEISGETIQEATDQICQMGRKYAIYYNHLTPIVYMKVRDGNVELTGRYLCEPRKCRNTESVIWERLFYRFKIYQIETK